MYVKYEYSGGGGLVRAARVAQHVSVVITVVGLLNLFRGYTDNLFHVNYAYRIRVCVCTSEARVYLMHTRLRTFDPECIFPTNFPPAIIIVVGPHFSSVLNGRIYILLCV